MYKNIFNRVGVNIHSLYDSNIIYYLYLKSLNLDKKNIIFIDIGYRSTKVLMIKNEKISLIKTLPIGSYFITNDLVKILNVSYDFADKLKIILKEPLIKSKWSLAFKLIHNQGIVLQAWLVTSKNNNAECGSAWKPRRVSLEAHIYVVPALTKDSGH